MRFKRVLLYIWISLLLMVAVFFLLRNSAPRSLANEEVDLPTGVKVILHNGADLRSFEESKGLLRLELDGLCYISVSDHPGRQVLIFTDEARIGIQNGAAVIDGGTAYVTEVIVADGTVSLAPNPQKDRRKIRMIELRPGEKGIVSPTARGVIKQNNRDKHFMVWADFRFRFDDQPLGEVVALLSDAYGVPIRLAAPGSCRLTGSYEGMRLEALMERLAIELGLEAVREEDESWTLAGDCTGGSDNS